MSAFVKAAVIGHPVAHSKSPLIHTHWIERYGQQGAYEAIDLSPEDLESGIKRLIGEGYSGFNFTIPHKEAALTLCDSLDPAAQKIGAVNTLAVKDGKTRGMNTDVFGFVQNIKMAQPGFSFAGGPAVLLGAGGAARAVLYGLLEEGSPEIRLVNRTQAKAEKLAEELGAGKTRVIPWESRHEALAGAHLLVNTTALGMEGQPALDLDLSALPPAALVNDILYAPLHTKLLRTAQERGNPVVTGIGMLLHQARPAFRAWFGVMPEVDEALMKKVVP